MAIALVAHTIAGSVVGGTITTSAIDTSGATLLIAGIVDQNFAPSTLSDSKSNSGWVELTSYIYTDHQRTRLFYAPSPTVGSGHTFTATCVLSYPRIVVAAFSGVILSSPLDAETGHPNSASGTTVLPGSITPAEAGEVFVTLAGWEIVTPPDTTSMGISDSFTISDDVGNGADGGANYGAAMAYLVHTTGALNPTWTHGASMYGTAAMAAFKAVAFVETFPAWKSILAPQSLERRLWAGVTY